MTQVVVMRPIQSVAPINRFQELIDVDWPGSPVDNSVLVYAGGKVNLLPGLGSAAFQDSTSFEPAGAVATHAAQTTTHGVSGQIVGTINTQTLVNKTLTSPVLTGLPTAPTPIQNDSSTLIATTAFVYSAILTLIDSAPSDSDTFAKLAARLSTDEASLQSHEADYNNPHQVTAGQVGLSSLVTPFPPSNGQILVFNSLSGKYVATNPTVGDRNLVVTLSPPATSFLINHNLGKIPSVRVVDTGGNDLLCPIQNVPGNELNALTIKSNFEFSGKAILN